MSELFLSKKYDEIAFTAISSGPHLVENIKYYKSLLLNIINDLIAQHINNRDSRLLADTYNDCLIVSETLYNASVSGQAAFGIAFLQTFNNDAMERMSLAASYNGNDIKNESYTFFDIFAEKISAAKDALILSRPELKKYASKDVKPSRLASELGINDIPPERE